MAVTKKVNVGWRKNYCRLLKNICRRIKFHSSVPVKYIVGCGEIKPPGTTSQLVDEDRARTAEILKRQLHVRIMKSKDSKEFVTFGVVFNGFNIELYVMAFDFENTPPPLSTL